MRDTIFQIKYFPRLKYMKVDTKLDTVKVVKLDTILITRPTQIIKPTWKDYTNAFLVGMAIGIGIFVITIIVIRR